VHSAEGGGDPNNLVNAQREQVDQPAVDFDKLSPEMQAQLQALGKAMELAEQQVRQGNVDPKLLSDLGMSQAQFAAFVKEYTDRFGQIHKMADQTARPAAAGEAPAMNIGQQGLQTGRGADSGVTGRGGEKLSPDELKKLYEQRSAGVSPEFRSQVEAYFRAISEGRADSPTSAPAK
jgi:hypothetical protein